MSLSPFPMHDVLVTKDGKTTVTWREWVLNIYATVKGLATDLAVEHAADGTHRDVTASSLTVSGAATVSGVIAAAGGQVVFPATQSASSDANTLDDYAEGAWTPGLAFGGGTTGMTYTSQDGTYVKVGKLVCAQYRVALSAKGSSAGNATLTGLPITPAGTTDVGANVVTVATGMAGLTSAPTGLPLASGVANFGDWGATGRVALDESNFTDSTVIAGVVLYMAGA